MKALEACGTFLTILFLVSILHAQDAPPPIRVWLVPAEFPAQDAGERGDAVRRSAEVFRAKWEKEGVTILNLQAPLDSRLEARNVEYAVSNWLLISGQEGTLGALANFAAANRVTVAIRFVGFDEAFQELRESGPLTPDVAQIGNSWTGFFATNPEPKIVPLPGDIADRGMWRDVLGMKHIALPYLTDLRLILYWKRFPWETTAAPEFPRLGSTWAEILSTLNRQDRDTDYIAFPTAITLNLLHNLAPLIEAGGPRMVTKPFGPFANLTRNNALEIPSLFASEVKSAADGHRRPAVRFPEVSYQELDRSFLLGEMRAVVDRLGFVAVWKDSFVRHWGKQPAEFWDYADAIVPPAVFHGGSDLVVFHPRSEAFALAMFLANDKDYTDALGQSGQLPSQHVDGALDALVGENPSLNTAQLKGEIRRALGSPNTYPEVAPWPVEVEATDVLEKLQTVWRRAGEGRPDALQSAAWQAELTMNLRMNWTIWLLYNLSLPAIMILAVFFAYRHFLRARAADDVRKIRGFSASALTVLATRHNISRFLVGTAGPLRAEKSLMIASGLQGWRRGRDDTNWRVRPLPNVIWQAILLSFEALQDSDLSSQWTRSALSIEAFLCGKAILRQNSATRTAARSYHFELHCPKNAKAPTPFMLEQALVCLIQNAIQSVDRACDDDDSPRSTIVIQYQGDRLEIINLGKAPAVEILELFREQLPPELFETRILELLKSPDYEKPGIGLVEAYCIAQQCYHGLSLSAVGGAVTATVYFRSPWSLFKRKAGKLFKSRGTPA